MPQHEARAYKSRELTEGQRAAVLSQVPYRGDAVDPPSGWRQRTLFDFSACSHTAMHMVEIPTPYGKWGMMICVNCGAQVRKECLHVHCTWHVDGKVLICDNCGVDGT